jgi:hypothetical protein
MDIKYYRQQVLKAKAVRSRFFLLMADLLATMFPDALFLNLQRDGRRVVHSMVHFLDRFPAERRAELLVNKKIPPWASSFQDVCQHWRTFVEAGKGFAFSARAVTSMKPYKGETRSSCFVAPKKGRSHHRAEVKPAHDLLLPGTRNGE